MNIFVVIERG